MRTCRNQAAFEPVLLDLDFDEPRNNDPQYDKKVSQCHGHVPDDFDDEILVSFNRLPVNTDCVESLFRVKIAFFDTVLTAVGVLILVELGIFIDLLIDTKYFTMTS